jgi:hypothetical protein
MALSYLQCGGDLRQTHAVALGGLGGVRAGYGRRIFAGGDDEHRRADGIRLGRPLGGGVRPGGVIPGAPDQARIPLGKRIPGRRGVGHGQHLEGHGHVGHVLGPDLDGASTGILRRLGRPALGRDEDGEALQRDSVGLYHLRLAVHGEGYGLCVGVGGRGIFQHRAAELDDGRGYARRGALRDVPVIGDEGLLPHGQHVRAHGVTVGVRYIRAGYNNL